MRSDTCLKWRISQTNGLGLKRYLNGRRSLTRFESSHQTLNRVLSEEIEQGLFEQENILSYASVDQLRKTVYQTYERFDKVIEGLDSIVSNILDSYNWEHIISFNQFKKNGESEHGIF